MAEAQWADCYWRLLPWESTTMQLNIWTPAKRWDAFNFRGTLHQGWLIGYFAIFKLMPGNFAVLLVNIDKRPMQIQSACVSIYENIKQELLSVWL